MRRHGRRRWAHNLNAGWIISEKIDAEVGHHPYRPCAARRWRPRRLYLGRAGPLAGGRALADRRHQRHQRRRDECGGSGAWLPRRWPGWRAASVARLLESSQRFCAVQPPATHRHRPRAGTLDARRIARLSAVRTGNQPGVAVPVQSFRHQPAARPGRRNGGLRQGPGLHPVKALHFSDQRAHRPFPHFPARGSQPGRGHGLGLPAAGVSGGRGGRRAVLGRRLYRQSGVVPAGGRDGCA